MEKIINKKIIIKIKPVNILMYIKDLPWELQHIVYEYDDTYRVKFKDCIEQLNFLYRTFPIKVNMIISSHQTFQIIAVTPVKKIPELNRFIFEYCNRKRSLRSFKQYRLPTYQRNI